MADGTYLAVFYSDKNGPKWKAWYALTEEERKAKDAIGLPALEAWDEKHRDVIVYPGRPLGKTLQVSDDGSTGPVVNQLTAFVVVKAPSLEAATQLFVDHPHMSIFPCHAVDVMPLLGMETDDEGRPRG